MPPKTKPFQFHLDRALADLSSKYIVSANGCWLWNRAVDSRGYGIASIGKKTFKMHRFTAQYLKGLNIKGLHVCHACDIPNCINPDHLWTGTHQDNVDDMMSKNRHPQCGRRGISIVTPQGRFSTMTETRRALGITQRELLTRLKTMPDQYKKER